MSRSDSAGIAPCKESCVSLNDFPVRDSNSELADRAESKFDQAIVQAGRFVVQQRDRRDYGTDFQLEAKQSGAMTNFRVHAQVKGTDKRPNRDGSVSISVDRTNLNYLLSQPHSIYVCFHEPTDRLLVRTAEDVYRDGEHRDPRWQEQDSVTVRFHAPFDADFQAVLHGRTLAASTAVRNDRLTWVAATPDRFPEAVRAHVPTIHVPEAPEDAFGVLQALYEQHSDEVISKAFDQFVACFGADDERLAPAYLAEINLAMRNQPFDRDRVGEGLSFLAAMRGGDEPSALYCRANGRLALEEREEAIRLYREAIRRIDGRIPELEAQCWKNLGSAVELEGDHDEARRCYERALSLAPDLMEAHFALGCSHREHGDLEAAIRHFDQVVWASDDVRPTVAARGYRIDVCFCLGLTEKAFDDIAAILPYADQHSWILPWCARQVYNHARTQPGSLMRAVRFWDAYLRKRPDDRAARRERLKCLGAARMRQQDTGMTFSQYVAQVSALLAEDRVDAALLWDRVGHWAQEDKDWRQAETHFRKAYSIEPNRYGYCLGTALNSLGRFDESLPILQEQATVHQPDAMSWFQVAVAQEGVGDFDGCKDSYARALALNPDYAEAMFNLGGTHWNHGAKEDAVRVWSEALQRFPTNPEAEQLRSEFGFLFTDAGPA